jgi:hypothetical protein
LSSTHRLRVLKSPAASEPRENQENAYNVRWHNDSVSDRGDNQDSLGSGRQRDPASLRNIREPEEQPIKQQQQAK